MYLLSCLWASKLGTTGRLLSAAFRFQCPCRTGRTSSSSRGHSGRHTLPQCIWTLLPPAASLRFRNWGKANKNQRHCILFYVAIYCITLAIISYCVLFCFKWYYVKLYTLCYDEIHCITLYYITYTTLHHVYIYVHTFTLVHLRLPLHLPLHWPLHLPLHLLSHLHYITWHDMTLR